MERGSVKEVMEMSSSELCVVFQTIKCARGPNFGLLKLNHFNDNDEVNRQKRNDKRQNRKKRRKKTLMTMNGDA